MHYGFSGTQRDHDAHDAYRESLLIYREHLAQVAAHKRYDVPEAALATLVDETQREFAERVRDALGPVKQVVVVGIGGSSMGVEAVYRALEREDTPILHVVDVLDHEHVVAVAQALCAHPLEESAICVISKSGSTAETLANADALLSLVRPTFGERIWERVVCIGDSGTKLERFARERSMHFVEMPGHVGGRYSIFSVVGLVPLALLGIPLDTFLSGGVDALLELAPQQVEKPDTTTENTALAAAMSRLSRMRAGDRINVLFAEHERLYGCVKWFEQLLAESLGKDKTTDGADNPYALAVIPMSPRELHSTAQLFLSRFPGVYTIFLGATIEHAHSTLSTSGFGALVTLSGDRSYDRVRTAITEGVRAAYRTHRMPHATYDLGELSAYEIGLFMGRSLLEVMYTAHALSLNAFDQPHVELYKKETRRILEGGAVETEEEGVYVLLDIGGTKTRVALSTDLATLEVVEKFPTPLRYDDGIALLKKEIERLVGTRTIRAVAGGIRGMLDRDHTMMISDLVLPDWANKPLQADLARSTHAPVYLENDAALVALGEAVFGAGKGYDIVAYHTVSTGVGGARIVHGRIDRSAAGFEPGQQVVDLDMTVVPALQKEGIWEELTSGSALERRTGKKPYETPQSDTALWDELARYVAYGLKNTIAYWSPDAIVLGGSMVVGDPRILREDIVRHMRTITGRLACPPILDATLKDEGGLYGAMGFLQSKGL